MPGPEPDPDAKGKQEIQPIDPVRFVLFVGLVAFVILWSERHLAVSVAYTRLLQLLAAAASVFLFVWKAFYGNKESRGLLAPILRGAMKRSSLAGLYFAVLLLGSMVSSVRVIADGAPLPVHVQLTRQGASRGELGESPHALEASREELGFLAIPGPFRASYVLEVEGYRPHSLELRPWVGATVRVGSELQPSGLLVRVPPPCLGVLDGGTIELFDAKTKERIASAPTSKPAAQGSPANLQSGAVFFGPRVSIPAEMLRRWEWEARVASGNETQVASYLRAWERPIRADLPNPPRTGTSLVARFHNQSNEVLAELDFEYTPAGIQDVVLVPLSK